MSDRVEVVLSQCGDSAEAKERVVTSYILWRGDREVLERGCARLSPLPPIATNKPFEIVIREMVE